MSGPHTIGEKRQQISIEINNNVTLFRFCEISPSIQQSQSITIHIRAASVEDRLSQHHVDADARLAAGLKLASIIWFKTKTRMATSAYARRRVGLFSSSNLLVNSDKRSDTSFS